MTKTIYLIQGLNGFQQWIDMSKNFGTLDECRELLSLWRENVPLGGFRIIERVITDRVIESEG